MLAVMFRSQSWATRVAGLAPLGVPGVVDVDASDLISAHADYAAQIRPLLRRVDLDGVRAPGK